MSPVRWYHIVLMSVLVTCLIAATFMAWVWFIAQGVKIATWIGWLP